MSMESVSDSAAVESPVGRGGRWRAAVVAVLVVTAGVLAIFHEEVSVAVGQWIHSGAYNHCFLIVPIALYMIWCNRAGLRGLTPVPSAWGLVAILGFGTLWFFATFSGIAEIAQFAVIGIVQGVLLAIFGGRVYRHLLFPFWYLWLLVPSGQFLVPSLQHLTAGMAGFLLDLTSVPTFHEGLLIEVPTGSYTVAPGCSGLNFLLAGLALAMAFAEIVYRNWSRRVAFVAAILVLAVVGNALRVFLIILIAHLTNNVGDIVDDHLIYGWGFFSLLLWVAMAIGNRFREDTAPKRPALPERVDNTSRFWPMGVLALAAAAAGPVVAQAGWPVPATATRFVAPALSCGAFERVDSGSDWVVPVPQVDSLASIDCRSGDRTVHLAVAWLNRPLREGKLVGLERWLIDADRWPLISRDETRQRVGDRFVPVSVFRVGQEDHERLLWSLHWVDGDWHAAGVDTALADLGAELAGHRRGALVLLATDAGEGDASLLLREYLERLPLNEIMGEDVPKPGQ